MKRGSTWSCRGRWKRIYYQETHWEELGGVEDVLGVVKEDGGHEEGGEDVPGLLEEGEGYEEGEGEDVPGVLVEDKEDMGKFTWSSRGR